jgi:hypothetical protein
MAVEMDDTDRAVLADVDVSPLTNQTTHFLSYRLMERSSGSVMV